MSSKYNRHSSVVSRQSDSNVDEDSWLHRFEKSLLKDAVQPKSQTNIFDQINSIMNGKSKFPSVDAAVQDMKERSGLTAYLDKMSSEKEIHVSKKVAQQQPAPQQPSNQNMPLVIQKHPAILKTLENYIRDTRGNLPVPAIIDKLRSIHSKDVPDAKDWDDDKLIIMVSKMNLQAKTDNPGSFQDYSNLGSRDSGSDNEVDPSNTDAFFALTPVKQ